MEMIFLLVICWGLIPTVYLNCPPPPTPPPRRPFWYHPAYVQNLRRYCFQLQLHSKSICFIRSLRPAGSVHVSVHRCCVHPLILSFGHWVNFIFSQRTLKFDYIHTGLVGRANGNNAVGVFKKAFERRRRRAQLRRSQRTNFIKTGYAAHRFKRGQFTEAGSWFWVWTRLVPAGKGKDCPPGWSTNFK